MLDRTHLTRLVTQTPLKIFVGRKRYSQLVLKIVFGAFGHFERCNLAQSGVLDEVHFALSPIAQGFEDEESIVDYRVLFHFQNFSPEDYLNEFLHTESL